MVDVRRAKGGPHPYDQRAFLKGMFIVHAFVFIAIATNIGDPMKSLVNWYTPFTALVIIAMAVFYLAWKE